MNIFRARTKVSKDIFNEGDWVRGHYFENEEGHFIKVPYADENGEGDIIKTIDFPIYPKSLCKSTGIKDSRGRLIFESHMVSGTADLKKYEEKTVARILDLESKKIESAEVEGVVRYDDEFNAFMFDSTLKPRFLWELRDLTIIADDPISIR